MKYFVVVQAPAFSMGPDRFAVESAFAVHLQALREQIGPAYDELVLVGPGMSKARWEAQASQMTEVDAQATGVRFVAAFPLEISRVRFLLQGFVPMWFWLKRLFAQPCVVNSGMSTELSRPLMFMASLAARRMKRPVIFMVDMDFRMHARRFYETGAWSYRSYLVNRWLYDPLKWLQLRLAPLLFDVCCFKGETLVRDFGRGRPNVRKFHDTVHSADDLLDAGQLKVRMEWIRNGSDGLAVVYFGRLAANKGISRIIEAVAICRDRGVNVHLRIVGDGDCKQELVEQAQRLELLKQVEFIDALPWGAPLFRSLQDQHVCVFAPLTEDTPRAAFDALCRGLPVVAFDIAWFRDLAAESHAVITTQWPESAGLADAFARLSADREEVARLSARAVAFAAVNTQQAWLERRLGWLKEVETGVRGQESRAGIS
jgi:glycosyltransferase involved in cell wall biosynthesis